MTSTLHLWHAVLGLWNLFTPGSTAASSPQFSVAAPLGDALGTYMRAATLNSTGIIAGYTQITGTPASGGVKTMQFAKSLDRGVTWSNVVDNVPSHYPIFGIGQRKHEIGNASILQLPSGRILYAARNHDVVANSSPEAFSYYRITVVYSDDYGITWNYLSTVAQLPNPSGVHGLWEPFLRLKVNGGVQCYFAQELGNTGNDQNIVLATSNDAGLHWSATSTVVGLDSTTSRDGMPGVSVRNPANHQQLICVFEAQATAGGPFKISYVTSNDDGSTWSARADVYAPSGVSTGAPQVILVGSTLVVSYMTGNGPQGVDGQSFEVVISTDMGQTWGGRALVSSGAHWPGLYALDSTTFLAMYRQDGAGALVTKRMVLSVVAASV